MSKRHKIPPVDLDDFKARKADEGAVPIKAGDRMFYIRPLEVMSDDQYLDYKNVAGKDIVAQARMMIDDYDDFVAAGGSAALLLSIWREHSDATSEAQGVEPGESEASSGS